MVIRKEINGKSVKIWLEGRLETSTAPELKKELENILPDAEELIFDFEKLQYVASAGLRVILSSQKKMAKQGEMKIVNVSQEVMDIFEVTGFVDILTIE